MRCRVFLDQRPPVGVGVLIQTAIQPDYRKWLMRTYPHQPLPSAPLKGAFAGSFRKRRLSSST